MFGRDRVRVNTVAFGPPSENYAVLEAMSTELPMGTFQKLGLSSLNLSSAFTSLTSDLSTLRTVGGSPGHGRTLRSDVQKESLSEIALDLAKADVHRKANKAVPVSNDDGWLMFYRRLTDPTVLESCTRCGVSSCLRVTEFRCGGCKLQKYCSKEHQRDDWQRHKTLCGLLGTCYGRAAHTNHTIRSKKRYDADCGVFVQESIDGMGIAVKNRFFAEGVERHAHRCTELKYKYTNALTSAWVEHGPALVAKECKIVEQLVDAQFHEQMCTLQATAATIAEEFNEIVRNLNGGRVIEPAFVSFIDTHIYEVVENSLPAKTNWILTERLLEGKFTKWNTNAGKVLSRQTQQTVRGGALGVICEEDEEEEENVREVMSWNTYYDVPQSLSHYSWSSTLGGILVCDLQGIWNELDGFEFTDPCVHSRDAKHTHGATDKGFNGIQNFFETHKCNDLCRAMRLTPFNNTRDAYSNLGARFGSKKSPKPKQKTGK